MFHDFIFTLFTVTLSDYKTAQRCSAFYVTHIVPSSAQTKYWFAVSLWVISILRNEATHYDHDSLTASLPRKSSGNTWFILENFKAQELMQQRLSCLSLVFCPFSGGQTQWNRRTPSHQTLSTHWTPHIWCWLLSTATGILNYML